MGGKSQAQTIGRKIRIGMHVILGVGIADSLRAVYSDKKRVWTGTISNTGGARTVDKPNLHGGEQGQGGMEGEFRFYTGELTQTVDPYLADQLDAPVPAWRRVSAVVFGNVGEPFSFQWNNPFIKALSFFVQRIMIRSDGSAQWYGATARIPSDNLPTFRIADVTGPDLDSRTNGGGNGTQGLANGITLTGFDPGETYTARVSTGFIHLGASWAASLGYVRDGNSADVETAGVFGRPDEQTAIDDFNALAFEVTGASEYTFFVFDTVAADNTGTLEFELVDGTQTITLNDMNPAHITREILEDTMWGLGEPSASINETAFTAFADVCDGEGFGLSYRPKQSDDAWGLIGQVLATADAVLYVDRRTGQWTPKAIRADYTKASLPLFTADDEVISSELQQEVASELFSRWSVDYFNREKLGMDSVSGNNPAARLAIGGVVAGKSSYPMIHKRSLAIAALERDLSSNGAVKWRGTIVCNRSIPYLNPGDVFRLTLPKQGISDVVFRVQRVSEGPMGSDRITLDIIQDKFALGSGTLVSVPTSPWVDPTEVEAVDADPQAVIESPYYMIAQTLGDSTAQSTFDNENDAGYIQASAGYTGSGGVGARIWVDADGDGSGYAESTQISFAPNFTLASVTDTLQTTSFVASSSTNMGLATAGTLFINPRTGEIVRLDSWTPGTSTAVLGRGCLDTIPVQMLTGDDLIEVLDYAGGVPTTFLAAETPNVKILTSTFSDVLSLANATENGLTMASRGYRPLRPANLQLEGEYAPVSITDGDELTWGAQNRLTQTTAAVSDYYDAGITTEAGVTYRIDLQGLDSLGAEVGSIYHTDTVNPGAAHTSGSYTMLSAEYASLAPTGAVTARVTVTAVRDGYDSFTSAALTIPLRDVRITTDGDTRVTTDGERRIPT